eukprot:6460762-Amphidinium_carterae.1
MSSHWCETKCTGNHGCSVCNLPWQCKRPKDGKRSDDKIVSMPTTIIGKYRCTSESLSVVCRAKTRSGQVQPLAYMTSLPEAQHGPHNCCPIPEASTISAQSEHPAACQC